VSTHIIRKTQDTEARVASLLLSCVRQRTQNPRTVVAGQLQHYPIYLPLNPLIQLLKEATLRHSTEQNLT
jgi:hypothetical protein